MVPDSNASTHGRCGADAERRLRTRWVTAAGRAFAFTMASIIFSDLLVLGQVGTTIDRRVRVGEYGASGW